MAISKAFGGTGTSSGSTTTVATGNINTTGKTHVVVFVKHEGATTTTTMSTNVGTLTWNALTKIGNRVAQDSWCQLHWAKLSGTSATQTFTATLGAARSFKTIGAWLITADSGDIELDAESVGTSISSIFEEPDAGSLVTSGASVVSFMGVAEYAVSTYTAGSGWTEDWDLNGSGSSYAFGQSRGPETTTPIDPVCDMSASSMDWAACSASFRELVGGAAALSIAPIVQNYRNMGIH